MKDISLRVTEIISKHLPVNAKVGVAISGGSDSMCLISIILKTGVIEKKNLSVINVEHGIRGDESVRDSAFVRSFCVANNLKLHFSAFDIPSLAAKNKRSIETEARLVRREFFSSLIESGEIEYVLTAHNASDQTETVLMHIFRGSGIGGLKGMGELDGYICRPLITSTKEEILSYVKSSGIEFVEDSTNNQLDYARNYLRLEIIPRIKEKWPGLDQAIANLSSAASSYLPDEPNENSVDAAWASGEEIIKLFKAAGLNVDYTKAHIEAVLGLTNRENGAGVDLPHGFRAQKENGKLAVFKKTLKCSDCISSNQTEFAIGEVKCSVLEAEIKPDKKRTVFDLDKVPPGAIYRTRRNGDRFRPVAGREKLLSDYLNDKKIPKRMRDLLVLLAKDNEVYVIAGIAVSEKVKIDESTKRARLLTTQGGQQ